MSKQVAIVLAILVFVLLLGRQVLKAANTVAPKLGLGTQRKSFLGRTDLPRGLRNNNPGNLKLTDPQQGWLGSIERPENTDGTFEQFLFYVYGLRAMIKLMRNKMKREGQNTIRRLIRSWAPPGENATEAYIANVAQASGIPQNQPIDINDRERLYALARAIELFENGQVVMSRTDFDQAFALL